jgi:putative copper resistance protein D
MTPPVGPNRPGGTPPAGPKRPGGTPPARPKRPGGTPRAATTAAAVTGLLVAAAVGWSVAPDAGPLLPAARYLLDACGVAAVGLGMLGWLVDGGRRRDADAALAVAGRAAVVLAGAWTATAVLLLWLQAAEVVGRPPAELGARDVAAYVRAFNPGAGLLVTAACAIGYGMIAATTRGRSWPELPTIVAILGLLPAPLTGHASSAALHELAVLSVTAHAIAVAVWVGGLGALLVIITARRTLLATALPRFSTIAAAALGTVAASGVVTAAVRLGSTAALIASGYGRIVLYKSVALIVLAVLGWRVRRRVLPAIRDHRPAPLVLLAGTELAIMAVALGLAAALTRAA